MKLWLRSFYGLLVLAGFTVSASAEILVQQNPIPIGNPATGSVGISSSLPEDLRNEFISRAYDNFTITEEVNVTGLEWFGAYNNEFNPNGDFRSFEMFNIEIFRSANNAPDVSDTGSVVEFDELDSGTAGRNDGTDVTSSIVPNQLQSQGGVIQNYQADLTPFALQPGEYWLAIQVRQNFPSPFPTQNPTDPNRHLDPTWSWVLSEGGDGRFFSFDQQFGDRVEPGSSITGTRRDAAFTLLGDAVGTPTPDNDFNNDGELDALDIDLLAAAVRGSSSDLSFDVNLDGSITAADHTSWLEDTGTLPGDADLDGRVAFADFLRLSQHFGLVGGWGNGNFNTDANVAFSDFLTLSQNFGRQASASSGLSASVPLFPSRQRTTSCCSDCSVFSAPFADESKSDRISLSAAHNRQVKQQRVIHLPLFLD